jgi:phosphopantetheinyl transferase (holo-ACP synthase)
MMARFLRPLLGNDIVDLESSVAIGKSRDARFLNRVCSAEERERVATAETPDFALWAIWSAKESAFKIAQKLDAEAIFAHRKFALNDETLSILQRKTAGDAFEGLLHYGNLSFRLRWTSEPGWLHCLALGPFEGDSARVELTSVVTEVRCSGDLDDLAWDLKLDAEELKSVHSAASRAVRALGKKLIRKRLQPVYCARIVRPERGSGLFAYPQAFDRSGTRLGCELSLSHDGGWIAAAVL